MKNRVFGKFKSSLLKKIEFLEFLVNRVFAKMLKKNPGVMSLTFSFGRSLDHVMASHPGLVSVTQTYDSHLAALEKKKSDTRHF